MSKLQEKLDEAKQKAAAAIEYHQSRAASFGPIYEKAFELGADFNCESPWASISLSGDKHKLAEMVRAFRTLGFNTSSERPASNSPSWSPTFTNSKGDFVFFYFTSSVCRRVKIGTKTEPERVVDVYETVCGEADGNGEPIPAAPEAVSVPF